MPISEPFKWECEGCGLGYDGPESGYCRVCGHPRPGESPTTEDRGAIVVCIDLAADTAPFQKALRAWVDLQKGISAGANR